MPLESLWRFHQNLRRNYPTIISVSISVRPLRGFLSNISRVSTNICVEIALWRLLAIPCGNSNQISKKIPIASLWRVYSNLCEVLARISRRENSTQISIMIPRVNSVKILVAFLWRVHSNLRVNSTPTSVDIRDKSL